MAFVSVIGPIARLLQLAPWHAGAAVTVGGVLWMLLARPWGAASDRLGRRRVLLIGLTGFTLAYWAMCAVLVLSVRLLPSAALVFAGLLLTRGAIGAFYAAISSTGAALVADHVPTERRAAALAGLGAVNALGMVMGPALAALLARYSLVLPLYVTAFLPPAALIVAWKTLPRHDLRRAGPESSLRLSDPRLRRPMAVAFIGMFCVAIAQITVGFFAIDRLGLTAAAATPVAGMALTAVGVALILSQLVVRRLGWPPLRLIRYGAVVGALGFGAMALVTSAPVLVACFFFAACGMGWLFPAFSALAANSVEAHEQGAAAGTVASAQGLGLVLGPLGGSLLYDLGPGVPYALSGVMLLALALWPGRRTDADRKKH